MERAIAVIDIGKSTTGLRIYSSRNLRMLEEKSCESREIKIGRLLTDNVDTTLKFITRSLKRKTRSTSRIKVIVPVTMGATIVLVDEDGKSLMPVISYQQKLDKDTHRKFSDFAAGKEKIYRQTATPDLPDGLIIARQIFWLRERKKGAFSRAFRIRCLPQYVAGRFAAIPPGKGEKSVEFSYLGCHTGLYNFRTRNWSYLAKKLGVVGTLFPKKIFRAWDSVGYVRPEIAKKTGLRPDCLVLLGGHDTTLSNIPYALREKKCVVFSTGSWHIATCLGAKFSLPRDGLKKDVLAYSDIEGKPAMAARSALGFEFKYYQKRIEKRFGRHKPPVRAGTKLLNEIIDRKDCFVLPTLTRGSGQFPDSRPGITGKDFFYRDLKTAYHVLELCLALQARVTIEASLGGETKRVPVYLTGGAAQDVLFTSILSTLLPKQKLITTKITEATSLGAAILGKAALEENHPLKTNPQLINYHDRIIPKLSVDSKKLEQYGERFINLCKKGGK